MAEIAVNFLLNQLSVWLTEECHLLGELEDDVQLIHDEMEQMKVFLGVVDAKEESDPQLAIWLRQLQNIAFDTEDTLEDYILRFAHHGRYSGIHGQLKKFCYSVKTLKAKHQMASNIKAISSRAQNACKTYNEYKDKYPIPPGSSSIAIARNVSYNGRDDALLLEEAHLVGIQQPKMELLNWISTNDKKLGVVAVVGMAGLGKTTLVKKVYDDPSLKEKFDHHVWITVSETYIIKNLSQDMITQLLQEGKRPLPKELGTMDEAHMKELIYKFLQNETYIIVLDDIWNVDAWEALRYVFPRSNTLGRGCIIITTRFTNIGDTACCESGGYVYALQPLPPHDAKELFFKKAFLGDPCPQYLKEISQNILKRCGGLPLAIVLIGGSLATKKNDIVEWENFNIGLGAEVEGDGPKRMWKLISLSYYDLPYYLKSCLLFLCNFPEDHLLEKATVVRLWMAEGYVEVKQGKTMEDVATRYLYDLSNRSLIQVAQTSDDGRPNKFRIHDVVREYVISKAREHGIIARKSKNGTPSTTKVRCLTLDDSSTDVIAQKNNLKHLHSLLFFGSFDSVLESRLYKILRGDCKMLKELDLRGATIDTIPEEVFKLYHLKYISLRNTKVSLIPKQIENLEKLETLDLKETEVIGLPNEILKLQRLQFLLVYSYDQFPHQVAPLNIVRGFKISCEIGRLVNLQKLCYIDASVNVKIVKEVGKLRELRRLGLLNVREQEGKELCSSLAKLDKLQSLSIGSREEGEMLDLQYSLSSNHSLPFLRLLELRGRLERVPQWVCSLNALTKLHLLWSRLQEDPLKSLQGLPNLQILELSYAYEGEGLSFVCGGFPKLKQLFLNGLGGLRRVSVERGSMPCLSTFQMIGCKSMMELSLGIEHLRELVDVTLVEMSKDFLKMLHEHKEREGHEWKLNHVPQVFIGNWVDNEWTEWLM